MLESELRVHYRSICREHPYWFFQPAYRHRLSSLPEAVTCVVLILNTDPIHIHNVGCILACISSSASVQHLWPTITNFQHSFLATSHRIYKHIVRRHDCIDGYSPLYPKFDTREERIHSFITTPISGKH